MEWWALILLALGALALAFTIRDTWHSYRCRACRTAIRLVRDRHPDWLVSSSRHRAAEADRDVVAVFYHHPGHGCRPTPYRIVAVDRGSGAAEELPDEARSRYALKNYR